MVAWMLVSKPGCHRKDHIISNRQSEPKMNDDSSVSSSPPRASIANFVYLIMLWPLSKT